MRKYPCAAIVPLKIVLFVQLVPEADAYATCQLDMATVELPVL